MRLFKKKEEEDFELPPIEEFPSSTQPQQQIPQMPVPQPQQPIPQPQVPQIQPPQIQYQKPEKPHIYIKIDKYNELIDANNELKEIVKNIGAELDKLKGLQESEKESLEKLDEINKRIEEIVNLFEQTLTMPEE